MQTQTKPREYQPHGIESQRLTISIGRDLYERLVAFADRTGRSRSLVAKHAIEVYLRLKDEERSA